MASSDAPLAIHLDAVLSAHEPRGHTLVGPTVRDRSFALDDVDVPDAAADVSGKLRARLVKPAAGRRTGPDAGHAPSP